MQHVEETLDFNTEDKTQIERHTVSSSDNFGHQTRCPPRLKTSKMNGSISTDSTSENNSKTLKRPITMDEIPFSKESKLTQTWTLGHQLFKSQYQLHYQDHPRPTALHSTFNNQQSTINNQQSTINKKIE